MTGQVFPTQDRLDPDRQHLVQPARRYSYDVWNNKLTETDTLGHVTRYQYNDADQVIQKQEPLVDVVDEHGNNQALCPTTRFAYNVRGQQIAKKDANGNTHAVVFDTAGHKIIEILSEGTQRQVQLFDAFNNMVERRDAAGQATKYFYDRENNLLAFQKPSGSRRSYTYNELKQRISDADPANNIRRYNFDALGNIIEHYEPLGQCTRRVYGRNHQLSKIENPDNSFLTWQRDTFGKSLQHTDLSGALYRYDYDYKAQLIDAMSEGGNHGELLKLIPITGLIIDDNGFRQAINPVPGQHLHYQYISGQITEVNDFATGNKTSYRYDSEGRRFAVSVVSDKGEILRETTSQIDALGREFLTHDNQSVFTTAYDGVSNRRFIKGVIKTSNGGSLNQEVWWKYDTEDRVIVSEGVLENGQIKIISNKGAEFSYRNDLKVTESTIRENNRRITENFFYDNDGRQVGSRYDGFNATTERQYDNAGRQRLFKSVSDWVFGLKWITDKQRVYNENTWLIANVQTTTVPGQFQVVNRTDYQQLTAMGLPKQQTINYGDEAGDIDHLNCNYIGWDQWRIASIQVYRINIHGTSAHSSVKNYLGPNGEPNAISGAEDPDGRDKYFISTPEGLILRRMHLGYHLFSRDIFVPHLETYFFYRVNGQYLASYKKQRNKSFDLLLNWIRPQGSAGMEVGMSSATTNDFSSLPQIYTCGDKDTYESIANNLYGDASLASYIDAANGGTLVAGQTITIPQLISVHNKAGMARPYYQFLQIMQGSLMPHLDTPQPPDDDGFFGFLVKAIVVVVICVAAPVVAPEFVASLTATFGTAGALAVGAGLADAAAQGLCIDLGMQDHFSFGELATTMISAGFGAQLAPLAGEANAAEWMAFIVKAGAVNVEEQLAEMAIGVRQQFDLAGVALAMGSAGLSPKIKLDNPLKRRLISDIAVAGMSSVVRGRF